MAACRGGRAMSISTSRVMEYDPFSQEFQADPFPVYRWMRDEAPVFYSEKWNWWALSRFEDVRAAATDPQTFLSYEGIDIDDTAKDQSGPGFLPDIDNPRHDQIRRMIQPQLLPNRIAEREDAVRSVVRGLIDACGTAAPWTWPMNWPGRRRTRCSSTCSACPRPARRAGSSSTGGCTSSRTASPTTPGSPRWPRPPRPASRPTSSTCCGSGATGRARTW